MLVEAGEVFTLDMAVLPGIATLADLLHSPNPLDTARVLIDIPAIARVAEVGAIEARISDLSVGGLALQCQQPLPVNREVLAHFTLPGCADLIHVTGKVVNADGTGRAGIRFSFVPEEDLGNLESWLAVELARLEKAEMPTDYAQNYSD